MHVGEVKWSLLLLGASLLVKIVAYDAEFFDVLNEPEIPYDWEGPKSSKETQLANIAIKRNRINIIASQL